MALRRAIVVLALACAAFASIGPSAAFNWADIVPRDVSAAIATTANAYNGLTIVTCNGSALSPTTCSTNVVTNKGTTGQSYRILEELDANNKVSQYGIDGGTKVANGYTAWSAEKAIASTAALNLDLVACGTLTGCATTKTYQTYWTVEGQKAGTLDFTATKVQITIQYP